MFGIVAHGVVVGGGGGGVCVCLVSDLRGGVQHGTDTVSMPMVAETMPVRIWFSTARLSKQEIKKKHEVNI